jgi:hypothetical protein
MFMFDRCAFKQVMRSLVNRLCRAQDGSLQTCASTMPMRSESIGTAFDRRSAKAPAGQQLPRKRRVAVELPGPLSQR